VFAELGFQPELFVTPHLCVAHLAAATESAPDAEDLQTPSAGE